MFGIGWQEILLIILVVLLLFGARRIPEVMRSIGKGVRELKQGMKDVDAPDKPEQQHKDDQGPKAD
jgi:sec-independent protein translocase protein TatA